MSRLHDVAFDAFTAMTVKKNAVFWDVAPCGFIMTRRFGETCLLHLQLEEIAPAKKSVRRLLTN
jgi:hypothetical protein